MSLTDIQSAWQSNVWDAAAITNYSGTILDYEHTDSSETEAGALLYNQRINFWEHVEAETAEWVEVGNPTPRRRYLIEARYTLEQDPDGDAFKSVGAAMATLLDTVVANLGSTWGGTVDFSALQDSAPEVYSAVVADCPVWRAIYRFIGFRAE